MSDKNNTDDNSENEEEKKYFEIEFTSENESDSDQESSIGDIIYEAMQIAAKKAKERNKANSDVNAMVGTCSEFLNSFIILGYDFDGNAIDPVFYAKNERDADALNTHINKFFLKNMYKNGS